MKIFAESILRTNIFSSDIFLLNNQFFLLIGVLLLSDSTYSYGLNFALVCYYPQFYKNDTFMVIKTDDNKILVEDAL